MEEFGAPIFFPNPSVTASDVESDDKRKHPEILAGPKLLTKVPMQLHLGTSNAPAKRSLMPLTKESPKIAAVEARRGPKHLRSASKGGGGVPLYDEKMMENIRTSAKVALIKHMSHGVGNDDILEWLNSIPPFPATRPGGSGDGFVLEPEFDQNFVIEEPELLLQQEVCTAPRIPSRLKPGASASSALEQSGRSQPKDEVPRAAVEIDSREELLDQVRRAKREGSVSQRTKKRVLKSLSFAFGVFTVRSMTGDSMSAARIDQK